MWKSVPVVWQNCLYTGEYASELPVPVIWQNCLMWTVLCQWFGRIACASDLAELSVSGQCDSDLAELPV
jgi:hypothetical protein